MGMSERESSGEKLPKIAIRPYFIQECKKLAEAEGKDLDEEINAILIIGLGVSKTHVFNEAKLILTDFSGDKPANYVLSHKTPGKTTPNP